MLQELKTTESLAIYTPEIVVLPTTQEVDIYAANKLIEQVKTKPDSVLTLPTGLTPMGMYALFVQACRELRLDLSRLRTFNLDEYYRLSENHPASYATYMLENLFRHVDIPETQRHIPNSDAEDPNIEADNYEQMLNQFRVNLAILGLGPGSTCHIGFNERGSALNSRTRYVRLDDQTIGVNMLCFPNPREIPDGSITQGIGNILEAEQIMLLAKGEGKAWGIQRSINGNIDSDAPASFLRLHPHVTFILDQAAASLLH